MPMPGLFRERELAYLCLIRKYNRRVTILACPLQILNSLSLPLTICGTITDKKS